jgi:hypothetical protein
MRFDLNVRDGAFIPTPIQLRSAVLSVLNRHNGCPHRCARFRLDVHQERHRSTDTSPVASKLHGAHFIKNS